MVKANFFTIDGKKTKTADLPSQFSEEFRPDIIKRAFLAIQSKNFQPHGAFPRAGMRASAKMSRRRRKFKTSYGHGMSRSPRKAIWKRGTQHGWVGAVSPSTVSGRRAHPLKAEEKLSQKINIKERRKAIRSALAASANEKLVKERGHLFKDLPTVIDNKIESISKTKDFEKVIKALNLNKELERTSERKIRAGKGTRRGRKYRTKKGPLFVISEKCKLESAAKNVLGVDVCLVKNLNVNLLAPGGLPGRLTIYSEKAIEQIKKDGLFLTKSKKDKK